jgi:hypothetical protein
MTEFHGHVNGFLENLPPRTRDQVTAEIRRRITREVPTWFGASARGMTPDQFAEFMSELFAPAGRALADQVFHGIKAMAATVEARVKERFTPKPRNTERDEKIVALHDEDGLSFGRIGRRLAALNPRWGGKGGRPLSRDAVEKAYHRRKGRADK